MVRTKSQNIALQIGSTVYVVFNYTTYIHTSHEPSLELFVDFSGFYSFMSGNEKPKGGSVWYYYDTMYEKV